MIFDNLEVRHKSFGDGVVTAKNGKYMTVRFSSAEKVFVYPDAFENFLTLSNGAITEEIENDIKASKEQKQQILNKKHEENMRAMTRGIVIPGKETAQIDGEDEEHRFKSSEPEEV